MINIYLWTKKYLTIFAKRNPVVMGFFLFYKNDEKALF